MTTNYNKTQLDPASTFERHVYHRDQFAHYLRWTHVLKIAKIGMNILDYGCGTKLNLAEVLYRNKFKCKQYLGLDVRKARADKLLEKDWIDFEQCDLVSEDVETKYSQHHDWDMITSFEVIEHIGKENVDRFLLNIQHCMNDDTIFLLSTPVYDERVGAAKNHIIDGVVQEYGYDELKKILEKYFKIKNVWGTFASQKDYKKIMTYEEKELFDRLSTYYESSLVSVIMAPLFSKYSRNCLWRLKLK